VGEFADAVAASTDSTAAVIQTGGWLAGLLTDGATLAGTESVAQNALFVSNWVSVGGFGATLAADCSDGNTGIGWFSGVPSGSAEVFSLGPISVYAASSTLNGAVTTAAGFMLPSVGILQAGDAWLSLSNDANVTSFPLP
jgi:hypothetical protein